MHLFYLPNIKSDATFVAFDKEESKHIVRVLRKKIGDELHATDGLGNLFALEITTTDEKKCLAKVTTATRREQRSYHLHLVVAPTKMIDRYEWLIEKATEIGVDEITPVICDHSERKVLKTDRLKKITQSAMKQSLQTYLPIIHEPITLSKWLQVKRGGIKLIAHCGSGEKQTLKSKLEIGKEVVILIGPEGDFSTHEIAIAQEAGFVPVTLGDNRLRTETAALTACQNVAFINSL
jgi:16S rRNA (uracil1498-N3)-methyltransferase